MSIHLVSTHAQTAPASLQPGASEPVMSMRRVRELVAALLIVFSAILIFLAVDGLSIPMRVTLFVFAGTIIGWTVLDLPETPVALAGAIALATSGAIGEEMLYRSLGNEIIWLLLAAFVIAGVLRHLGIVEHLIGRLVPRLRTVRSLFWVLTLVTFATAFIIPSTSARAAILMPVFLGLTAAIGNAAVTRALALLFPSVILLSAGASLIGAGAHLVAADFMGRFAGGSPDFLAWLLLAGPFSLVMCLIACGLVLHLFLSKEERDVLLADRMKDKGSEAPNAFTRPQWLASAVVVAAVILFASEALHGVGMALVATVAALLLCTPQVAGLTLKKALGFVEWNLLLFMAGTLVIGEALIETGTAQMLADRVVALIRQSAITSPSLVIAFAALVATVSHLLITSRTARATVLIPAFALPLAALGANPASLIMIVTLASGFCQTLTVSAKPVALFGGMEPAPFSASDLLRLASYLALPFIGLLVLVAVLLWPVQGVPLQ